MQREKSPILPKMHRSVRIFHYQTHALIPNSTQGTGCRPIRSAQGIFSTAQKKIPPKNNSPKPAKPAVCRHPMSTVLQGKKVSSVLMPRQAVRIQRNFRPSALKSIKSMSLKSSCHFWVKQARDIPQQEAGIFISQKLWPII